MLAPSGYVVQEPWAVISALPERDSTRYHVVGPEPQGPVRDVPPLAPTLEDGYVWLRQQRRDVGDVTTASA